MRVSFTIMANVAEFALDISYRDDGFEFSPRIAMTPENIRHIVARWGEIERIRSINLNGQRPCRWYFYRDDAGHCWPVGPWTPRGFIRNEEYIDTTLSARLYLYPSRPLLAWSAEPAIEDSLWEMFTPILSALKPVLIGTVKLRLPELKSEARAIVKANAIRRARIMAGNAEAILAFLGEDIG